MKRDQAHGHASVAMPPANYETACKMETAVAVPAGLNLKGSVSKT